MATIDHLWWRRRRLLRRSPAAGPVSPEPARQHDALADGARDQARPCLPSIVIPARNGGGGAEYAGVQTAALGVVTSKRACGQRVDRHCVAKRRTKPGVDVVQCALSPVPSGVQVPQVPRGCDLQALDVGDGGTRQVRCLRHALEVLLHGCAVGVVRQVARQQAPGADAVARGLPACITTAPCQMRS